MGSTTSRHVHRTARCRAGRSLYEINGKRWLSREDHMVRENRPWYLNDARAGLRGPDCAGRFPSFAVRTVLLELQRLLCVIPRDQQYINIYINI